MVGALAADCPRAALVLVATSSDAVLSANRLAASSAFAAGWAALSSALASFTEYLGSTRAKSTGAWAFSAEAGTCASDAVEAEATGAEVTGAEASTSCGAALAATDFTAGAGWRWARTALRMVRTKLPSG